MTAIRPAAALVWLTRAVWLVAALALLCSATLAIYWRLEGTMSAPKPLQLPPRDQAAAPAALAAASPERNPFDPAGVAWRAPAAANEQVARLEDVRGVLTSGALSGVFTPAGLVKPGDAFAGGTLEAVTPEALVVRMPDGNTKRLQPARQDDKVRQQLLELWAASKAR